MHTYQRNYLLLITIVVAFIVMSSARRSSHIPPWAFIKHKSHQRLCTFFQGFFFWIIFTVPEMQPKIPKEILLYFKWRHVLALRDLGKTLEKPHAATGSVQTTWSKRVDFQEWVRKGPLCSRWHLVNLEGSINWTRSLPESQISNVVEDGWQCGTGHASTTDAAASTACLHNSTVSPLSCIEIQVNRKRKKKSRR